MRANEYWELIKNKLNESNDVIDLIDSETFVLSNSLWNF